MRMSQLERTLGLTLLQRSPAGTKLTPAGERVAVLGRRVLGEVQALTAGVAALVAEEGSHLRVAASLTVAEYLSAGSAPCTGGDQAWCWPLRSPNSLAGARPGS